MVINGASCPYEVATKTSEAKSVLSPAQRYPISRVMITPAGILNFGLIVLLAGRSFRDGTNPLFPSLLLSFLPVS